MTEPVFFRQARALTLREVVTLVGAKVVRAADAARLDRRVSGIAALEDAGPADAAFCDNPRYAASLELSAAGAVLVLPKFAARVPEHTVVLEAAQPYRAFVTLARTLFADALRPSSLYEARGSANGACVHPSARLESGVTVDPAAVIGPRAEIGAGTVVAAGAVIGPDCRIGRNCAIGANSTVAHALIGDRVIVHPGCQIGQDGFGYTPDARGHVKVPQVGRVIVQNDVEIGAGSMIDRGANRDTVIGEGTKIDNLVQVGHNVVIGRHCIIVAQSGISGSVTLEDRVVLGARVGINNHVRVGEGAQIAATSTIKDDVPAGARWGGTPAKPARQWFREMMALERLGRSAPAAKATPEAADE